MRGYVGARELPVEVLGESGVRGVQIFNGQSVSTEVGPHADGFGVAFEHLSGMLVSPAGRMTPACEIMNGLEVHAHCRSTPSGAVSAASQ